MFPIKNSQDEIFGLMLEISDVTEIKKYTNAIEEQNKKFREIAWLQSHIVRAPLARMMGIINLIKDNDLDIAEHRDFLVHLSASADELDTIIRDITSKTREIK
jgi:light-regulated signal transduction histidine kinase (bacteriophytochrome)